MWTAAGLDGEDARGGQSAVFDQELLVFASEDVVRHGSCTVIMVNSQSIVENDS